MLAWISWGATLIVGAVVCIIVCKKIESTDLERLGATGKLFSYEKKNKGE